MLELLFEDGSLRQIYDRTNNIENVRSIITGKLVNSETRKRISEISEREEKIKQVAKSFIYPYAGIFNQFDFEKWQIQERVVQIKEKAQETFRNKQFKLAAELYESVKEELTQSQKKKFQYANKNKIVLK